MPGPKFYKVATNGPSWWFVASSKRAAWSLWIDWHETGSLDDDDMEDRPVMTALTEDEAKRIRIIDDDSGKSTLAEFSIGATFCSEY